jgi:nicotinic acid phosphoribosyltransferase
MNKYWQNSITFDEYIKETERRIEVQNPEDDHNEYYELGLQRMNRTLKTFKIDEEQLSVLKSKNLLGKFSLFQNLGVEMLAQLFLRLQSF